MGAYSHLKELRCLVAKTYRLTLSFVLLLFLYNQVSAGTISGTLHHSDGLTPIINEYVSVELSQEGRYINSAYVSSEDGTYSFEGVEPGLYSVRISPYPFCGPFVIEWYASPESVRNESSSQLVSAPSDGIDFQLDRGSTFSGTIYHADGETPITEGYVMIEIIEGDPCSDDSRVAGWSGQDISTGNYTIVAIATGTYYIGTATHPDYDIHKKEWWNFPLSELSCSLAQAITVNDGEVITGKDFQMDLKSSNDNSGTAVLYRDSDGDGYGDPDMPYDSTSQLSGFVVDSNDCVDYDPSIHPGATEICGDNIDQNCDGLDTVCEPDPALAYEIQKLYIGYLGRAADKAGLNYWVNGIATGVITMEQLRTNLTNEQPEYTIIYGGLTRRQLASQIYRNLFEREPDADGLEYWVNGGGSIVNADQLIVAYLNAASGADQLVLDNKTTEAMYETENEPTNCDSNHLNLCTAAGECLTADGYWWSNNTCNSTAEPNSIAYGGASTDQIKQWLDSHNQYRSIHQVEPFTWSTAIAASAQAYADTCPTEHSDSGFGENLAWGYSSIPAVVNAWYEEEEVYDYDNPGFSSAVGHFTQVVWKGTIEIGCALKTQCPQWPTTWICQYNPPGNYYGQFAQNVFPPIAPR